MLFLGDAAADELAIVLLLSVGRMVDIDPYQCRGLKACAVSMSVACTSRNPTHRLDSLAADGEPSLLGMVDLQVQLGDEAPAGAGRLLFAGDEVLQGSCRHAEERGVAHSKKCRRDPAGASLPLPRRAAATTAYRRRSGSLVRRGERERKTGNFPFQMMLLLSGAMSGRVVQRRGVL